MGMKKFLLGLVGIVCALFAISAYALPAGYTELEYIESTGTQYIDTGVQATGDLDIKTRFKIISYGGLLGVRDVATGSSNKAVWLAALDARTIWLYNNKTTHNHLEKLNLDQWYDADIKKGVLSFDGNEVASYETENFTGSDIFLFNTNEANGTLSSGASVQISYFKIYDASGTLVRNLIPVKYTSGNTTTIGMYDTVSGTFFENSGTGTFIAGPETTGPCANMFNVSTATDALLNSQNGSVVETSNNYYASDHIPVQANQTYVLSPAMLDSGLYGLAWYDANKTYISGSLYNQSDSQRFVAPANAAYVRFSGLASNAPNTYFKPAYCSEIQVATTKYVETEFSALNTALANAVATVNTVVTQTIAQAASIATLQSGKQTRPDETCPAGEKCLLVTDENNIPHWYEIVTGRLPDGYTELEYINKPSGAYTNSGIKFTSENVTIEITGSSSSMASGMFGAQDSSNNHSALLIYANRLYAGEMGFADATIFDSDLHKIIIEANNKNITLTNYAGEVVNLSYTQSIQSRNGWYIGGMISNNSVLADSIGRVGIIKIWDNGNLVFHGIPAKYGEEIGFYDIVQNRFLTSMSEQKFTAGPVAE